MRKSKQFKSEQEIYRIATEHLKNNYPGVLYFIDSSATVGLSRTQAEQHGAFQASAGWQGLFIPAPMYAKFEDKDPRYMGLFIAARATGAKIMRDRGATRPLKGETERRRKGDWWDGRTEAQADVISYLKMNRYCATFAIGPENIIGVIDRYMATYKQHLERVKDTFQKELDDAFEKEDQELAGNEEH